MIMIMKMIMEMIVRMILIGGMRMIKKSIQIPLLSEEEELFPPLPLPQKKNF